MDIQMYGISEKRFTIYSENNNSRQERNNL